MTTPPFEPLTSSVMPRIRPHSPPDPRPFRGFLATLLLLAPAACDPAAETIPYSELKARLAAGEVEAVRVSATRVEATPTEGARDAGAPEGGWRAVPLPEDPGLVPLLEARGVRYEGLPAGGPPVYVLLPLLAGALVVVFLVARAQRGRGVGVPRAAALRVRESGAGDSRTRFEDVAGVDEVKEELRELVEFLRDPGRFERLGVRIPKGVLLVGPPGTGKTLLARAVAGEAGVPFFSLSGSDFVEVYVGVGASRVRQLFDRARAKAPCIVFLDELDAVGRSRSGGPGSNDEREQTLNQLLVEMDGFRTGTGIIVMAATNRPEILDGALLRPGRFDRQVALTRPDAAGREAILQVHARRVPLAPDVDLGEVARQTPGFSGADLANLLNEAGLLTARAGRETIGVPELESAIERVVAGLEKKGRLANPKERRIVAVHEAGHAVVTAALEGAERVRKVTIVPRSIGALGLTYRLTEERSVLQRDELLARLAVLLAGRAAEQRVFGQVSSGAGNDLERASALARRMVSELGMSEALGPVAFGPAHGRLLPGSAEEVTGCSEDTARRIDREVQELLSEAAREAQVALEERRSALDALTERLLEREVVHRDELLAIMAADQGLAGPAPAAASA